MTNINIKLKKILALTLAVAMVFSIAAVSTLTAKASETHSNSYNLIVAAYAQNPNVNLTKGFSFIGFDIDDQYKDYYRTLTIEEAKELDQLYASEYGDVPGFEDNLKRFLSEPWKDPMTGAWSCHWLWAEKNPAQAEQKKKENEAIYGTSNNNNSSGSADASDNKTQITNGDDIDEYGWSSEILEHYGYDTTFKHHNVGFTFIAESGIKFRVTKASGYRQLGHVEIIGYQGDKINIDSDGSNAAIEMTKNSSDTIRNKSNILSHIARCYMNSSAVETRGRGKHKQTKTVYKSGFEGRNTELFDFYEDMVVDTYNRGMFGRTSYRYHDFFLITSIAPGAFKGNTVLKTVYIPESVQTIPKDCFKGCTNLQTVYWGSNALKYVKGHGLMTASGTPKYNAKKKICKGAFAKCKKLKNFNLDGLYANIKIEKGAFEKDKKSITVNTFKCKNKFTKDFVKNIKAKGKAKKAAKSKKSSSFGF